jgi:hypothetical protein
MEWASLGRSDAQAVADQLKVLVGYDIWLVMVGLDHNRGLLPGKHCWTTLSKVELRRTEARRDIVLMTKDGDAVISTLGNLGKCLIDLRTKTVSGTGVALVNGGCVQFRHDDNTWQGKPVAQIMVFL